MLGFIIINIRLKLLALTPLHWMKLGLIGVLVAFVSGASFYALTLPSKGSADAPAHLDYVWQVYNDRLPVFSDGTTAPFVSKKPVQFVSQHPPLYYSIVAPFAGPFLADNRIDTGIKVARATTILLGILSVAAFAWAGWVFGGRYRYLMTVTLPGFATAGIPFIRISGDIMNDTLIVLTSTLALTISARMIQRGAHLWYIVPAGLVATVGMASRATFISALAITFFAVYFAVLWHQKGSLIRKLTKATLLNIGIGLAPLLSIGWFYLRNYHMSGSWQRSGGQEWVAIYQGRPYRSAQEILIGSELWKVLPTQLFGQAWTGVHVAWYWGLNKIVSELVFITALFGVLRQAGSLLPRKLISVKTALFTILFLQLLIVFVGMISHAIGYGAINIRYLLPAWLPICLFIVYGFHHLPKVPQAAPLVLIGMTWVSVILNSVWYINERYPTITANSMWARVLEVTERLNGIPISVIYLLLTGIFIGFCLQVIAVVRLGRASQVRKTS